MAYTVMTMSWRLICERKLNVCTLNSQYCQLWLRFSVSDQELSGASICVNDLSLDAELSFWDQTASSSVKETENKKSEAAAAVRRRRNGCSGRVRLSLQGIRIRTCTSTCTSTRMFRASTSFSSRYPYHGTRMFSKFCALILICVNKLRLCNSVEYKFLLKVSHISTSTRSSTVSLQGIPY